MLIVEDEPRAYEYAGKLSEGVFKDESGALNAIAWTMVDPDSVMVSKPDYELATRIARRASELTENENASILDTLAVALFHSGKVGEAIEIQRKAVKLAGDTQMGAELRERLEEFEAEGDDDDGDHHGGDDDDGDDSHGDDDDDKEHGDDD